MKALVEDILGIRSNATIGNSVTREVEDVMRSRRPFVNTSIRNIETRQGAEVTSSNNINIRNNGLTSQEEGANTSDKTNHKKHSHKHGHKHGHSHKHSYKHGHRHNHKHGHNHNRSK